MPEDRVKFPSEISTSVLAVRIDAELKSEVKKVHESDPAFAREVCTAALVKALNKRKNRRRPVTA
jgi:hypothetical protein